MELNILLDYSSLSKIFSNVEFSHPFTFFFFSVFLFSLCISNSSVWFIFVSFSIEILQYRHQVKIFHFFSSNLLTRVASYLNSSSGLNDRKHRKDQKNQGGFRETKKKNEKFEKVVLRRGRINKSLRATLHATVW